MKTLTLMVVPVKSVYHKFSFSEKCRISVETILMQVAGVIIDNQIRCWKKNV